MYNETLLLSYYAVLKSKTLPLLHDVQYDDQSEDSHDDAYSAAFGSSMLVP